MSTKENKVDEIIIKINRDGDKICALWGENLQEGLCGFGDTVPEALEALALDWREQRGDEAYL